MNDNLIIENINFKEKIKEYIAKFADEFSIHPIIGCELEFYVSNNDVIELIKEKIVIDLPLIEIESEQGNNQFEIKFLPSKNILQLISDFNNVKEKLKKIASKNNTKIYFDAKPFIDQPGSAIHIHLNFLDKNSRNVFAKQAGQESDYLLFTIGGLIDIIKESMLFFAPKQKSYDRYVKSMSTPIVIAWGGNNRTTAIRIPPGNKGPRRVEHRVPCADADIAATIAIILFGAYHGITMKILPPIKIFGNAFDTQYQLEKLPINIENISQLFISNKKLIENFLVVHRPV